jgi:hypothetical protein
LFDDAHAVGAHYAVGSMLIADINHDAAVSLFRISCTDLKESGKLEAV